MQSDGDLSSLPEGVTNGTWTGGGAFVVVAGICLWNLVRAWRKGEIATRYGSTVSRAKSPRLFVFLVVSNSVGLAVMVAGLIACAIPGVLSG